MIKFIIRGVLMFIAFSALTYFVSKEQETDSKYKNIIRTPKAILWVGIVGTSMMLIIIFAFIFSMENGVKKIVDIAVIAIFLIIGIILILEYKNWRIEIIGDEFIYRTFFRKTYKLKFSDVKIKKQTVNTATIVYNRKKFYVDLHAINVEDFIKRIKVMRKDL